MILQILYSSIDLIWIWLEIGIILTLTASLMSIIGVTYIRLRHIHQVDIVATHISRILVSALMIIGCVHFYGSGIVNELQSSLDPAALSALILGYCVVSVFRSSKVLFYMALLLLVGAPWSYIYNPGSLVYKSLLTHAIILIIIACLYSRFTNSSYEND